MATRRRVAAGVRGCRRVRQLARLHGHSAGLRSHLHLPRPTATVSPLLTILSILCGRLGTPKEKRVGNRKVVNHYSRNLKQHIDKNAASAGFYSLVIENKIYQNCVQNSLTYPTVDNPTFLSWTLSSV